jgi:hypothetical protein
MSRSGPTISLTTRGVQDEVTLRPALSVVQPRVSYVSRAHSPPPPRSEPGEHFPSSGIPRLTSQASSERTSYLPEGAGDSLRAARVSSALSGDRSQSSSHFASGSAAQPLRGILKRPSDSRPPPVETNRRPSSPTPSVTFSDLGAIANPKKVRADVGGGGPDDEDMKAIEDNAMRMQQPAMGDDDLEDSESDYSGSSGSDDGRDSVGSEDGGGDRSPNVSPLGGGSSKRSSSSSSSSKKLPSFGSSAGFDDLMMGEGPVTPFNQISQDRERKDRMQKKAKLCAKFERKNAYRKTDKKITFNSNMTLEELEQIDEMECYSTRSELSVKVLRRVLVFVCKLIEALSKRFKMLGLDLEGWPEEVYLGLDTYDDLLFEIHDEYCAGMKLNPLAQLGLALGSNAVMYSMTKKLMSHPATNAICNALGEQFKQQQQQKDGGAAAGAAASSSKPADGFANLINSIMGNLGGAGQAPMTKRGGSTEGLELDGEDGNGDIDLNGMFSSISSMLGGGGRGAAKPTAATTAAGVGGGVVEEEIRGLGSTVPQDLRDEYDDHSGMRAPSPPKHAPNVRDQRGLLPTMSERQQGSSSISAFHSAGSAPASVMISILRQEEDAHKRSKGLATIEEMKEGEALDDGDDGGDENSAQAKRQQAKEEKDMEDEEEKEAKVVRTISLPEPTRAESKRSTASKRISIIE